MAIHTAQQKEFIVRKLAAFEPPRAIALAFAAVFRDTRCDENDVLATDPETNLVAPELYALFLSERERVKNDPNAAPFAGQEERFIALSNQVKFFTRNNQFAEARLAMRQIAEEQGLVGGKGKSAAGEKPTEPALPVTAITRTFIDPAPAATE